MGVFYKKRKTKHQEKYDKDMCETPAYVYDMVLGELDPKRHVIWQPFQRTGYSSRHMRARGFLVLDGEVDFFSRQSAPSVEDGQVLVVVTTPPFSTRRKVVAKLHELRIKHVAIFVPIGMLITLYVQDCFPPNLVQLIYHTTGCSFLDPTTFKGRGNTGFDLVWITKGLNMSEGVQFKGKQSILDKTNL